MWICLEQIEGLGCAERDDSILVGPVWRTWSLVPMKRCSFPRPVIPQAEQPHPMHWAGAGDAGSEWKAERGLEHPVLCPMGTGRPWEGAISAESCSGEAGRATCLLFA